MESDTGHSGSADMETQRQEDEGRVENQQNTGSRRPLPGPRSRSADPLTPTPTPGSSAARELSVDYFDPAVSLTLRPQASSRQSIRSAAQNGAAAAATSEDSRPASRSSNHRPSIRIRRKSNASLRSIGSNLTLSPAGAAPSSDLFASAAARAQAASASHHRRLRSASQPTLRPPQQGDSPVGVRHSRRAPQAALPRLTEEGTRPTMQELGLAGPALTPVTSLPNSMSRRRINSVDVTSNSSQRNRLGRFGRRLWLWPGGNARARRTSHDTMSHGLVHDDEYGEHLVDLLDTIDPEVQTLSTLTNIQNSLFVPNLGSLVNRRPTYVLTQHDVDRLESRPGTGESARPHGESHLAGVLAPPDDTIEEVPTEEQPPPMRRTDTITSRLTDSHYAALPHGVSLANWTEEEKWELDDHVRHMLHSRRSRFKRTMKGFGQYVRRPLGFLVTLYAFCITAFGLAWVLFLIGWVYVGAKQEYTIHVIDSVLVALFAIVGDGMAPFRALDTYRMIFVARYSRIMTKGKKKRAEIEAAEAGKSSDASAATAPLADNEKPAPLGGQCDGSVETEKIAGPWRPPSPIAEDEETGLAEDEAEDLYPLTAKQQKRFLHHRKKLAKSHSFYKPHETSTHYKFPLSSLVAVVLLLDLHSCLQISLGATTWGIDYRTRHPAITSVILAISITTNVVAGLVILKGDRKTRKKDVLKLLDRQELTSDAMKKLEGKKRKKAEKQREREEKRERKERDREGERRDKEEEREEKQREKEAVREEKQRIKEARQRDKKEEKERKKRERGG